MKVYISEATYIETDELSDEKLVKAHAYYYHLGRRDVALKLMEETEKRQHVELKKKKEVKKSADINEDN